MKHTLILMGLALAVLTSCGPSKDEAATETAAPPSFTFSVVEQTDPSYSSLPGLQSFVFGTHNDDWIMFAGRKNGFHGFDSTYSANFPVKLANDSIFVFDSKSKQLYKMKSPSYGGDTANVFLCTNLAHTQKDNYLYACGGYGTSDKANPSAKKTYSYFMRVNLEQAIAAVKANKPDDFKKAINWGKAI